MSREFCSRCGARYDGVSVHGPGSCGPAPGQMIATEEPEVIFSIELNETDRARRAEEDRRWRS